MEDPAPRLFVGQHQWQQENAARNAESLSDLADRLLAIDGKTVVVPPDNPDLVEVELAELLAEGRPYDPANATLEAGEPSECHANVARLWQAGRGAICTGYALSSARWRSHSWIATETGTIIETTEPREVYYGIELDDRSARAFTGSNGIGGRR